MCCCIVRSLVPLLLDIVCEGTSTTIDASSYNAATLQLDLVEDSTVIGKSTSVITVAPVISSAYNVEMSRGECKDYRQMDHGGFIQS